jgi:hypothetical protein
MQVTNSLSLWQGVAENTMTANKVLIAVIAFALLAKAYVILTS